jgi:accessory gene regulator protein AgrB
MTYLILIGLMLALLVNHAVFLFMRRTSIGARITVAVPLVLLLCIATLWMLGRILSHRAMDFGSTTAWLEVTLFSVFSTCALQAVYGKAR